MTMKMKINIHLTSCEMLHTCQVCGDLYTQNLEKYHNWTHLVSTGVGRDKTYQEMYYIPPNWRLV